MEYIITEEDKSLVAQGSVDYKYRLYIVDSNKNVLDEIEGMSSIGNYNINGDSEVRRVTSFTLLLDNYYMDKSIEKRLLFWIGYNFKLEIGIKSLRTDDFKWYECGYYTITEGNTTYNATENSITLNLSDFYSNLNGDRNGQVGGAPTIEIPIKDDNDNYFTIKQVTEGILKDNGITDYIVDDIGEFYGMPQNNENYEEYRKNNPLWNKLPYDLKYDAACYVSDMLDEIKNLYPNCQMYFDIYGNFCFNMIPSCEYDPISLDDDFIQSVLVSDNTENVTYDIKNIKNVTEVFGQSYEIDRYITDVNSSTNIYLASLDLYSEYVSGEFIAFIPNITNIGNMKISINSLSPIPIYYEYTSDYIEPNLLEAGNTYVLKIGYTENGYVAYYLGQYQPHALCVLSNDANDAKFTKDYFATKYNCDKKNVVIRIEKDSPFAVQKIGEVLDVKSGSDFDNILSDSVAKDNAIYYNRQSSSIYDTVNISVKMIPFLDVNKKIEYRKQQEEDTHFYIVKSIDNNLDTCISTISMYRFYPLYYN